MIEVRIDMDEMNKITHDVTHSIRMVEALKKAGIPFMGILLAKGVERGTLIWGREESLDSDIQIIQWYDTNETPLTGIRSKKEASGSGPGFTWVRYENPNAPKRIKALDPVEDEL